MITDGLQILIIGMSAVLIALSIFAAIAWIIVRISGVLRQRSQLIRFSDVKKQAMTAAVYAAIARLTAERKKP